jgi:hypothetical protein
MTDSKMYYDDLIRFIDRCGGTVIDKETTETLNIVTVRATFNEVRDFDMPSNIEVMFGQNHVRFDIDYSLPDL